VDRTCPRCASESYAFLSSWLPSEERRRWRRPALAAPTGGSWSSVGISGLIRSFGRWLAGEPGPDDARTGPSTRASDHVPQMHFDTVKEEPAAQRRLDVPLTKHDVP
jgi:hypothetical protein